MNLRRLRGKRLLQAFSILVLLVLFFQNCTRVQVSSLNETPPQQNISSNNNAGNGDGYTGKPDKFQFFDLSRTCAELDLLGKPLPNAQIFWQYDSVAASNMPFLVREGCKDITPVPVEESELVFPPGIADQFSYLGNTFAAIKPPADFDVLAPPCPSGRSLIPGAIRRNLMSSADDWTRWPIFGLLASLDGSINSLPSYRLTYNSSVPGDVGGVEQIVTLKPGTEYMISFLARAGSVPNVLLRLSYFPGGSTPETDIAFANFDLTGKREPIISSGLTSPEYSIQPVANGYLCTFKFTSFPQSLGYQDEMKFRITPNGTFSQRTLPFPGQFDSATRNPGDTVFGGHAVLEQVSNYCQ